MSIKAMRDAIVYRLAEAFPGLNVEAGEGQMSAEDLKRLVVKAPAAYVSCVGTADSDDQGGSFVVTARWAVSIVTDRVGDRSKTASRADGATDILEAFLDLAYDTQWKNEQGKSTAAGVADRIRSHNLYAGNVNERGMSLWAITWEQDVAVAARNTAALRDFLGAHARFDINRDDLASDAEGVFETSADINVRTTP